jgi:hypothetical protein
MTCKQCKHFEECKDDAFFSGAEFDPNKSVEYCTGFELITNADRIRAMSDEELAIFLCGKMEFCAIDCPGAELCNSNGGRANGLVKWLQQPAGEE